ncbi:hypothetical protein KC19_VG286700 [Ceratodon purpureus]|uniref:Uncharacterized protein n=1 Tax=Ceratodon purpureus TaxID=3225 RepID=A0A8T0HVI4_CERPU|nr:hypothetical protein KC19_VG286700 [Ceratodon purpureus]
MLKVLLLQRKTRAASKKANVDRAPKKLPPPPDAADVVLQEHMSSTAQTVLQLAIGTRQSDLVVGIPFAMLLKIGQEGEINHGASWSDREAVAYLLPLQGNWRRYVPNTFAFFSGKT